MAVTSKLYTKFALSLAAKKVDLTTDVIKCALFTAFTPGTGQDDDQYMTAVKARGTECANSGGYTTGGATLAYTGTTNQAGSISSAGHVMKFTCDNIVWAVMSQSPLFAVVYDSSPGTDATNPAICYWDFGGAVSPGGQQLTLQIAAGGVLTYTVA